MKNIKLKVDGMTCGGCVKNIQNLLGEKAGISTATADLDSGTVSVEFNDAVIQEAAIKDAIEAAGFDVA